MSDDELRDLKFTASSMYGGKYFFPIEICYVLTSHSAGADTTASSEYAFYLAMTLYPGECDLFIKIIKGFGT